MRRNHELYYMYTCEQLYLVNTRMLQKQSLLLLKLLHPPSSSLFLSSPYINTISFSLQKMTSIFIRAVSIPGRALGWLLYYSFLSVALSTHALGLLGSAIVSAPKNVEELLRELFLLSRGWNGLFSLFVQFFEGHLI